MTSLQIKTEPVCHNGSSQICRLCMSKESLEYVFKDEQLKEWIWECLEIKISGDDRMSQVVCTICRIRLAEFHQFRVGCQEVQEVLQALIPDGTDGAQSLTVATQSEESSTHCHDDGMENDLLDIKDCIIKTIVVEKESDESSQQYSGGARTSDKSGNATTSDSNQEIETDSVQDYQCDICQKICSSSIKLAYHKQYHTRKLKKQTANASNPNKKQIETSTQCDVCQKKFLNRNLMLAHRRYVHGPKRHKCDICDVQYASRSDMTRHMYTKKHMDKVQEMQRLEVEESADKACAKQEKSINKKIMKDSNLLYEDLLAKYQPNHPNKKFDASGSAERNVCDKIFSNRRAIDSHKKYHKPKKYICHVCEKPCDRPGSLKRHLVTHLSNDERQKAKPSRDIETAPRPFKCDVCKSAFMNKNTLAVHNRAVHAPKKIECEICGFKFVAKHKLMRHLQKHVSRGHTKEDFRALKKQSQQNDESMNPKNDASDHLSVPNENKTNENDNAREKPATDQPFRCDVCQKAFENKALLNRHNRLVHRSRKHKCSVCGKCYTFRSQLNLHMKIHKLNLTESTAAKNFECQECHKIFSSWKGLYCHVRSQHVDQKPKPEQTFACTKCDKKFNAKKKLYGHIVNAHVEHKCDICKKTFPARFLLWRHKTKQLCKTTSSPDSEATADESNLEVSIQNGDETVSKETKTCDNKISIDASD